MDAATARLTTAEVIARLNNTGREEWAEMLNTLTNRELCCLWKEINPNASYVRTVGHWLCWRLAQTEDRDE